MTLDIQDFVAQASGELTVEDIPPAVRKRVNGALEDLTGEEGGPAGPAGDLYDAVVAKDESGDYTSIQTAVDNVSSGAVISVEAGTYDEQVSIDTSDISIFGAGQGETVIDAGGNDGRGIEVNSPGVTLREFTVIGPDESSEGSYGVKIQPFSSDGGLPGKPATVDSITVKGSYKTELDLIGVQNGTVSNVVLNGQNTRGVGLALSNCKNVSLENIETRDNNWGGIGLFTNGEFSSVELADITISNHTAANGESVAPIYLDPETENYDLPSLVPSYQYKITSEDYRDGDFQFFFETRSAANAYENVLESDGSISASVNKR
jgi:hypothetical protein